MGESKLMIISKLMDYYSIYNNTVNIIVINDVGKYNFHIGDYKWVTSNIRTVVQIVRDKTKIW